MAQRVKDRLSIYMCMSLVFGLEHILECLVVDRHLVLHHILSVSEPRCKQVHHLHEIHLCKPHAWNQVSVDILVNNALRAHHAGAHGGLLVFKNYSIVLLEIMFDCTEFHSLAVVGEKTIS